MTNHYHDPTDAKYGKVLSKETPAQMSAFKALNDAALGEGEGFALDKKTRELIAVAVATSTKCVYCIEGHAKAAKAAGATAQELAEAGWVTAAIEAGGAMTHTRLAIKFGTDHE